MKTAFTLIVCITTNILFGQIEQVKPFDESNQDESLVLFIKELKKATLIKDESFIKQNLAKETYIPSTSVETASPERFYDYYFNDESNSGVLWNSLNFVFKIGGGGFKNISTKTEYCMPYTSANLHDSEPFTEIASYVIALSSNTKVHKEANSESQIIKLLDYEIINISPEMSDLSEHWLKVITAEGKTGYVESTKVTHTISIRCGLVKENGRWKIKYCDGFD